MLTTTIFRLYPSESQIPQLNEIFTIYNRMKRTGYRLIFRGAKGIQQTLMQQCQNNPYVNTILTENKTKLEQQKMWLKKHATHLMQQLEVLELQIAKNSAKNSIDRSLPGLYSKRSSLQNRLTSLALKPIVFSTKRVFRQRIRGRLSREEFLIQRDASFRCDGKVQGGVQNNNLKLLPTKELRVSSFHKAYGRIPKHLRVPFEVNPAYTTIIGALKYSWSFNLSDHILASYVIARRGIGITELLPAGYK